MRIVAISLLLVACGPSAASEEGDDTSSAADGTGAPSCEMYDADLTDGVVVDVLVRNDGTVPAFFVPEGCGPYLALDITPPGDDAPLPHPDLCSPGSCEGIIDSQSCEAGCPNCGVPVAARIDGGVASSSSWAGILQRELELVDACAPAADCPATCFRPESAEPGVYFIEVRMFRSCTGACDCEPGQGPGACGIYGELELSDPFTLAGVLDYPAMTSIELVIAD